MRASPPQVPEDAAAAAQRRTLASFAVKPGGQREVEPLELLPAVLTLGAKDEGGEGTSDGFDRAGLDGWIEGQALRTAAVADLEEVVARDRSGAAPGREHAARGVAAALERVGEHGTRAALEAELQRAERQLGKIVEDRRDLPRLRIEPDLPGQLDVHALVGVAVNTIRNSWSGVEERT